MDTAERLARATVFGDAADAYARVRPPYPRVAMEALFQATALQAGDRVLEIGCGAGQATTALARHGLDVVALEPSASLATAAQTRLQNFTRAQVVRNTFEAFQDTAPYHAVVAALSFHWLDPDTRMEKIRSHLVANGFLAILTNLHPRPYTGFFARAQTVYRQLVPEWGDGNGKQTTDDTMRDAKPALQAAEGFAITATGAWDWEARFTTAEYRLLLSTFSDHRLLGPDRLGLVQDALGTILDEEYGGTVVRPYRTLLTVAQKVA